MLTLKVFIGLKSRKGYVNADFIHADKEEGENLHVNMINSFVQYSKTVRHQSLKLKKTLYGLHKIPRAL